MKQNVKQLSINLSNYTNCQKITKAKDGSGIWLISNFLKTITGCQHVKDFDETKIIAFLRHNGPL
jgi:hypothetical protein